MTAKHSLSMPAIRPEWFFSITALTVGLFMALATPPFQAPDEYAHFFRAFQLSEGRILAERSGNEVGGNLPVSVIKAPDPFDPLRFRPFLKVDTRIVAQLRNEQFAIEPRAWIDFMHTALYSPVPYVPAVTGIWTAKLMGASALDMMYASRLLTLLCWIVLVFSAIRLTPVFKWVSVLIGLLPMNVFLAASLSADAMTNGFAMLFTALILKSAIAGERTLDMREGAWILFISVILAMTKQTYLMLAALALIIPSERFGGGAAENGVSLYPGRSHHCSKYHLGLVCARNSSD
jgi:uncharacterized membrane protein